MSKDALKKLGYTVVDLQFSDEQWREGNDYLLGILANGPAISIIKEYEEVGETILTPLQKNGMVLRSGYLMRMLLKLGMKLINHNRLVTQTKHLHIKSPEDFEVFLKGRQEYVFKMAKYW